MADKTILFSDGVSKVPVKATDNGDGTYSLTTKVAAGAEVIGSVTTTPADSSGDVLDLAPPLDAGNAYAPGDVLFIPVLLANVARVNGGVGMLKSVEVIDVDGVGGAIDLYFLRTVQDVGALNDPLALSDAEAVEQLGWIEIVADDYKDHGGQKAVFKTPLSTGWNVDLLKGAVNSRDIYVFGVIREAKTYTAAALKLKFNVVYL
jgi:hypothetical protein